MTWPFVLVVGGGALALDVPPRSDLSVDTPITSEESGPSTPEEVLARFSAEPTIQQVHLWASDYANTSPHLIRRWLAASKSFAALPQLTLEYRLKNDWDQDFIYLTQAGAAAASPDDDLIATLEDGGRGQDATYLVRARWDLNELVMSSERIRVIGEAQDLAKLRDQILAEVTRLYFERRRLQAEMLLAPRTEPLGQVKDQLRLHELTAHIDALTGGAFSAQLPPQEPG